MASSASTTVLSDAALRPARWRASSCRPKLGGALKTSQPPPRPRPSAAPCWPIRRRSWSREHRASCQRRAHAQSVRAARARLRQSSAALRSTRRASATFKRGAPQGGLETESDVARTLHVHTLLVLAGPFFLSRHSGVRWGGFPVPSLVNWGTYIHTIIYIYNEEKALQFRSDGPTRPVLQILQLRRRYMCLPAPGRRTAQPQPQHNVHSRVRRRHRASPMLGV